MSDEKGQHEIAGLFNETMHTMTQDFLRKLLMEQHEAEVLNRIQVKAERIQVRAEREAKAEAFKNKHCKVLAPFMPFKKK